MCSELTLSNVCSSYRELVSTAPLSIPKVSSCALHPVRVSSLQCVMFCLLVQVVVSFWWVFFFSRIDLCDGKDRAILSLFYSLSQYKRKPSQAPHPAASSGLATPTSKLVAPSSSKVTGPGDSHTLPASRIARSISPSPKMTLGVNGEH